MDLLTLKQFASKLGGAISDRTLFDWAQKGLISKPGKGARGKGDPFLWMEQIVRYYQGQNSEEEDLLRAARIRSENARGRKAELQVAEMEGELVRAADVVATWSAALATCKAKFLAVSASLTDELAGITDPGIRKEIIDQAIQEALEELGGGEIVGRSAEFARTSTDGDASAAEADSE